MADQRDQNIPHHQPPSVNHLVLSLTEDDVVRLTLGEEVTITPVRRPGHRPQPPILTIKPPEGPSEVEKLKLWKEEAMVVLGEWESAWEAAGKPGRLGQSKAEALRELILENLR